MIGNIALTAVSGMTVARKRLDTAAGNIANMQSAGPPAGAVSPSQELLGQQAYRPQRTVAYSTAGGGVDSIQRPVDPATTRLYDPSNPAADSNGIVESPNVELAREFVEVKLALHAYRSNLKIMQTADQMMGELLDDET